MLLTFSFQSLIWVLAFTFTLVNSHLCVISPQQRGDINIQKAGDSTCFRHQPPCGGQPAGAPTGIYMGGKTTFIKFQQNFNHYEVGYPGYMDIALSQSPDMTQFDTLVIVGDRNEHAQWHQRNYTIPVVMPNIDCPKCVLRMRYISNKPGETTFYQCSDIVIKKANQTSLQTYPEDDSVPVNLKNTIDYLERRKTLTSRHRSHSAPNGTKIFGFSWDILRNPGTELVSVDTISGEVAKESYEKFYFNMGVGVQYGTPSPMEESYKFLMDQIACHSREIPYIFLLEHRNGNISQRPNKILWIDLSAKSIAGEYEIQQPASGHFVALSPFERTNFLALLISEDKEKQGSFNLTFATLNYMGVYEKHFMMPSGSQFINYLWATSDLTKQLYYVLLGDENSPQKLHSSILTYNITGRKVNMTQLDVSMYTISSFQVYEKTGQLFALSPGLFGIGQGSPAWSLVEINPISGNISLVMEVAPSGLFEEYYGGTVFNLDQENGIMYYVFRVANSHADVIASIDLVTNQVSFSQLTSLRHVYNLGRSYFSV